MTEAEAMNIDTPMEAEKPAADTSQEDEEDVSALEAQLDEAMGASETSQVDLLTALITGTEYSSNAALALQERAVYALIRAYCSLKMYDSVVAFVTNQDVYWPRLSKAKHAKVVRQILTICTELAPLEEQEALARAVEAWTIEANRTFLRHRVQTQLATVLYQRQQYTESLELVESLATELKQLDDKSLLVEIHLLEAKLHLELVNLPKAKASLTASRTAAHAIYVAPALQADLDSVSGTIHVQEKDYHTAHSYFLEAFEQLDQMKEREQAEQALLYMLLCQVLDTLRKTLEGTIKTSSSDTIVLTGKHIAYAGRPIDALEAVARAAKNRDLKEFEAVWEEYADVLQSDTLIARNLKLLQTQLLESNLLRVLEPYSHVELDHVAKMVQLPRPEVERKLSQMILDGTFQGIIDQGAGHVVVFEDTPTLPDTALEILENVDHVVTSLFARSEALRTMMI